MEYTALVLNQYQKLHIHDCNQHDNHHKFHLETFHLSYKLHYFFQDYFVFHDQLEQVFDKEILDKTLEISPNFKSWKMIQKASKDLNYEDKRCLFNTCSLHINDGYHLRLFG